MSLTLKVALSPVLLWQVVRTRASLPRLPEAEGPREGVVGRGPRLRLLVAGDSSAAGVGVSTQAQALAQPLARRLAESTGRRVAWQLVARSGLNTAQTLNLLRLQCVSADVAVIVTGVNDVVEQVASHRAVAQREAMATWLMHHAGVQHVAFLPLPPVHAFSGLPQPLRWIAGSDAVRHNEALERWIQGQDSAALSLVPIEFLVRNGTLADDGFHPGLEAYRVVVDAVAEHLAGRLGAKPQSTGIGRGLPSASMAT